MSQPQVVVLAGPTGVGKSALAIAVAQRCDAEIVNADSRQVYRRLDIGSAKPTVAERAQLPHHLFDVAEPDEHFDCARYRELALAAIADIHARGRRALVVGGTGLYLKVLRGGVFAGPPRDDELRRRWLAREQAEPGALAARLAEVDPAAAARVHRNDQVRLLRAVEVFELTGRPISQWQAEHGFAQHRLNARTLVLSLDRDELYRRIEHRCRAMLDAGLVEEVRGLLGDYRDDLPSFASPGYREIIDHLRGRCTLAEATTRMMQATRRLAKRQLTWFRGDREAEWLAADGEALAVATAAFATA